MSEREEQRGAVEIAWRLVLAVRRRFLASGADPLSHWDQIQTRLLGAARTSSTTAEFGTRLLRGLRLDAPSRETSSILAELEESWGHVPRRFLSEVERAHVLIVAKARLEAERRKAARRGTMFEREEEIG